jgi:hypothetical protein
MMTPGEVTALIGIWMTDHTLDTGKFFIITLPLHIIVIVNHRIINVYSNEAAVDCIYIALY